MSETLSAAEYRRQLAVPKKKKAPKKVGTTGLPVEEMAHRRTVATAERPHVFIHGAIKDREQATEDLRAAIAAVPALSGLRVEAHVHVHPALP